MRLVVILAVALAAILCALLWPRMMARSKLMAGDDATTKAAVLQRIPIGTPVADVQAIMTSEGFTCIAMKNRKFADHDPTGKPIIVGPTDFLWCDSGDRAGGGVLVSKRWQVSFEDRGGAVSYIGTGVGLTGP